MKYIYLVVAILLLLTSGATYYFHNELVLAKAENSRLVLNVKVLNDKFSTNKTDKGHTSASVQALTYTKKEVKDYSTRTNEQAKELNIKPNDIASTTEIGIENNLHVTAPIQPVDSCFAYRDSFNTVYGCVHPKFVTLDIQTRDSLTTFVNPIYKHHFLWWRWKVKAIQLSIIAQNPNTTFNYLKYIEIKK